MNISTMNKKVLLVSILVSVFAIIFLLAMLGLSVNYAQRYIGYNSLSVNTSDSYIGNTAETSSYGLGKTTSYPIIGSDGVDVNNPNRLTTENYNFSIESLDVQKTVSEIESFVIGNNGIIVNSSISQRSSNITGNLYVAVPRDSVENFKSLIGNIASRILNSNQYGNDITEHYSDLNRRLEQLESTQTKLQSIYEQANTVDELLSVQQALIRNLNEIDSVKGQLKNSEERSKITYFSISISTDDIALPITEQKKWQPLALAKDGLRDLVIGMQSFVNILIRLIIVILPLILIYSLPILLVIWLIQKNKARKKVVDKVNKDESK